MAAIKAPLLCLILLLAASAVLVADAASCDQSSKLGLCKDALLRETDAVERDCCDVLSEQYSCLCEYARMPNSDYLHELTQEVGGIVLASCGLDGLSCTSSSSATA